MSDITQEGLVEILDAREEKTLTTIRLILENSLEKISNDFKLAMVKMDSTVAKQISDNQKDIERLERECVHCRGNDIETIKTETKDQELRIRKLERWFWAASGVVVVGGALIGMLK